MNKYEKIQKQEDQNFKLITGVTKAVFKKMLKILKKDYQSTRRKGGRKGLSVELRLTMAFEYWREYRIMCHMALDYEVPKSTLCKYIIWVEDVLRRSEEFKIKELK